MGQLTLHVDTNPRVFFRYSQIAFSLLLALTGLCPLLSANAQQPPQIFSGQNQNLDLPPFVGTVGRIQAGLVDSDGNVDLLIRGTSGSLHTANGFGNGTFVINPATPVPNVSDFGAVDLNADGKLDCVTVPTIGSPSILLNDGFGNLTACGSAATNLFFPTVRSFADFNLDGIPDVVVTSVNAASNAILVISPNCSTPTVYPFSLVSAASALTAGDFNSDGIVDLFHSSGAYYFSAPGTGTIGQVMSVPVAPACGGPIALSAVDVTGDGIVDAVATHASGHLVVTRSKTGGTFEYPVYYETGAYASNPILQQIMDVNGDGNADAVVGVDTIGNCKYLPGTGNPTQSFLAPETIPTGPDCISISLGDFNNDGAVDFAGATTSSNLFIIPGSMGALPTQNIQLPLILQPVALAPADLNQDGMPDIATVHKHSGLQMTWYGSQAGPPVATTVSLTGAKPVDMVIADFNLDQVPDIACAHETTNTVSISLNSGSGYFATVSNAPAPASPSALTVADFNSDGIADLAAGTTVSGVMNTYHNNGAGSLSPAQLAPAFGPVARIASADFNKDGRMDLVCTSPVGSAGANGQLVLALATPGGYYLSSVIPTPSAESLLLEDVNLDGNVDILTGGVYFCILRGDGLGGFPGAVSCAPVSGSPFADLTNADFNFDGAPDVAAGNSLGLQLYLNSPAGLPPLPSVHSIGNRPLRLASVDFDVDGRTDLISMSSDIVSSGLPILVVLRNLTLPTTTALQKFGSGTPGCVGTITLHAGTAPKVNANPFVLECMNAPPNAAGVLIIANAGDLTGSDPLGIGALLHLDFFQATEVFSLNFTTSTSGTGTVTTQIPNVPALVGKTYFAQSLAIAPPGQDCAGGSLKLLSSMGLALTILP